MMQKKLTKFILTNKNTNINILSNYQEETFFKKLNFGLNNELKAYLMLFNVLKNLNKIEKTIMIYHENYITIFYKTKQFSKKIIYKFNNIENKILKKLYKFYNPSVFINCTNTMIKFKSEHERFPEIIIDCYHNNVSRLKVKELNIKLYLFINFFLNK